MNGTEPDPREDKLPRWAQEKFAILRMQRDEQTRRAVRAEAVKEDHTLTDVVIPDHIRGNHIGLPQGSTVRFWLSPNGSKLREQDYVDVRVEDGEASIRTNRPVRIRVGSANSLWVRNER